MSSAQSVESLTLSSCALGLQSHRNRVRFMAQCVIRWATWFRGRTSFCGA
jgi:hypothetical protein